MLCPKWLGKAIRPLYRIRSWSLGHKWAGRDTKADRALRAVCEYLIDRVELWENQPAFERMEAHIAEADRITKNLEALRRKFKLDD